MKKILLSLLTGLTLYTTQTTHAAEGRPLSRTERDEQTRANQAAIAAQPKTRPSAELPSSVRPTSSAAAAAPASQTQAATSTHTPAKGPVLFTSQPATEISRKPLIAEPLHIIASDTDGLLKDLNNALGNPEKEPELLLRAKLEHKLRNGTIDYNQLISLFKETKNTKGLFVVSDALIKLYERYAYLFTIPENRFMPKIVTDNIFGVRTQFPWQEDSDAMKQIVAELGNIHRILSEIAPNNPKTWLLGQKIALLKRRKWAASAEAVTGLTAATIAGLKLWRR